MDDADRALAAENDREMGPVEPTLTPVIDKAVLVACRNFKEEAAKCLATIGQDTMRQMLEGMLRKL